MDQHSTPYSDTEIITTGNEKWLKVGGVDVFAIGEWRFRWKMTAVAEVEGEFSSLPTIIEETDLVGWTVN